MLLSKTVLMKWNIKNKQYYESLGYKFTRFKDEFEVPVEHLLPSSKAIVDVQCDFCGETVVKKTYQTYRKQHHSQYGDCCVKCQPIKNRLCCIDKYGVSNVMDVDGVKEKLKRTFLDKYGVDNPSKSDIVKKKISEKSKANSKESYAKAKITITERYGVDCIMHVPEIKERQKNAVFEKYGVYHPLQSEEIRNRMAEHNMEKYGQANVSQVPEFRDKSKQTCLRKYGVECSLSATSVREKIVQTLISNGSVPTSKQQIELAKMLEEMYGSCELNSPCGRCALDCVVVVDGIKIDVEFDGWYWHQDAQRDRRRDEYVKSRGYKILRIVGSHEIPTREQIEKKVAFLTTTQHKFTQIKLV